MLNTSFPIRKDLFGLRYVFFLGNEGGNCKYNCTFCEIGKSNAVTSEYNIELFDGLFKDYKKKVNGEKNHPLIYNRGNITDEKAFSRRTLLHLLSHFNSISNITHVSLNSREQEVTKEFIEFIFKINLSYPIHFILGQESFSSLTHHTIGKNSNGEFNRLVSKLIPFNEKKYLQKNKNYNYGIDCNLLFLPELYIGKENRNQHSKEIAVGFIEDINNTLKYSSPQVPLTININPFYKVKSLPFKNADINQLLDLLPLIMELVNKHNKERKHKITVFIGFRGIKTGNKQIDLKIDRWNNIFNLFNENNKLYETSEN